MKLTKRQIQRIESAYKKAIKAEGLLSSAICILSRAITESTAVDGYVDFLPGDGFGFAPDAKYTHISIDDILKLARAGEDITESKIIDSTSF